MSTSIAACRALLAGAAALALAAPASARVEGDAVVLGSAISLTGRHSREGKNLKDGYDLAVKEINGKGGVTVGGKSYELQIKYYDDESKPKRTAELVERLIGHDGVTFLLGPYGSEATRAAAAVAEKSKVPMVEAGAVSRSLFERGYRYLFAVLSDSEQYLAGAIELAAEGARRSGRKPGDVRVALVFADDAFSQEVRSGVIDRAAKYGMRIVVDERLANDALDLAAALAKVKTARPDALFVSSDAKGASVAAREIAGMEIRVPLVAMTHCDAADLPARLAAAAEGFVCPAQWDERLHYRDRLFGSARDYARLFRATFLDYAEVPYRAAQGSAAVEIWGNALERAQSFDTERLRDAIAATDLETFYGRIDFDATGRNTAKPMALRRIRDGAYVVVSPTEAATVPRTAHASR